MKEIAGIVAGVVSLIAYLPYIMSIIKGETKPSRSSWWIWSLVGLIILISYYNVGARNTIWIPIVFFICPLITAILSLKFGANDALTSLDKSCIAIAIFSIAFWLIFKTAAITLFINIFIDFLGFIPTLKKTLINPLQESKMSWILFSIGSLFNIFAAENYSLNIVTYPIYMTIMDTIMLLLIFRVEISKMVMRESPK